MLELLFPRLLQKLQNFPGITTSPDPQFVSGTNQVCFQAPRFAHILLNMQHFINYWSMKIFFTSGIGFDTLMKVF